MEVHYLELLVDKLSDALTSLANYSMMVQRVQ